MSVGLISLEAECIMLGLNFKIDLMKLELCFVKLGLKLERDLEDGQWQN